MHTRTIHILRILYDPDETRTELFVFYSRSMSLHDEKTNSLLQTDAHKNTVVNLYKRYLNLKNDRLITSVGEDGGGRIMRVAYGCKHLHAIFLKRIISEKCA